MLSVFSVVETELPFLRTPKEGDDAVLVAVLVPGTLDEVCHMLRFADTVFILLDGFIPA